jgi:Tol biopolymer transport system component
VAFASESSNLVSHDTNQAMDIFVHDLLSGGTQRISVATDGTQADGDSSDPALSADGRFVAFASYASNLVEGDTNGTVDVFVHDRLRHQTQLISVASDSSPGNNDSFSPAISADGRYVAFTSWANNLVGDDTNHQVDVFVHDRQTGQTGRISLASDGTQGNNRSSSPTVSADGRFVAFVSRSNNLVSGDTNQAEDIFVHDRQSGITQRVSLASDGSQGNGLSEHPTISADGRFVAFKSDASNLVSADTNLISDVFVHNRQSGQTRLASLVTNRTQGNGNSDWPAISADGLHLTFESAASNLVSDDTNGFKDIFFQEWGTQEPTNVHADFNASPLYGVNSLTVTFTNHTTCGGRDVACNVSTNLWFFGDGETSLQLSPTHTYTAPGVYNVTLFASGPGGTDSLTRNAYVVVRGQLSHYIPLVTR